MAFKDKEVFSKLFIAAVVTAFICIPIGLIARKSGEFACIETKEQANILYEISKGKSLGLLIGNDYLDCDTVSESSAKNTVFFSFLPVLLIAFVIIDYRSEDSLFHM